MEIIAVIFTLWSVYLTIKNKTLCWPIGIIGIGGYLYLFVGERLYAQAILQIIFAIQSFYGWYFWGKHKESKGRTIRNSRFTNDLIWILALTVGFSFLFQHTDNPQPFLDVLTTVLSLYANWYLAKKIIFGWRLWIIADILMVSLFLIQGMYWSGALYILLTWLAIKGLKEWEKNLKTA